jgi:hypothetical protein
VDKVSVFFYAVVDGGGSLCFGVLCAEWEYKRALLGKKEGTTKNVALLIEKAIESYVISHSYILQSTDRLVPRTRAEQWCMRAASGVGSMSIGGGSNQTLPHFETSAKTAINVEEAFCEAATMAIAHEEMKRLSQPQLFVPPPTQPLDLRRNSRATSHMRNGCCWAVE